MNQQQTQELMMGAVLVALGYALYKQFFGITARPNANKAAQYADTKAITVDQATANGWQYFTDGTAIGPDGSYYMNDVLVWGPTK